MKKFKIDIQKFGGGDLENINLGPNGAMFGHIHWESTVYGSTPAEKAQLNKSKVNAKIYVLRTDGSWTQGNFTGNININGSVSNFDINKYVSSDWVLLAEKEIDVNHNSDGTKTIWIGGSINGPSGTSWSGVSVSGGANKALDTIPRYATSVQSLNSKTETTIKMNWSSDSTCDYIWYSTNNGSSWTAVGSVNATSGNYTISGLTANTTYNIKTRVRRKDSQLTTDSSTAGITTYDYPTLGGGSIFVIGETNRPLIQMSNPLKRDLTVTILTENNVEVKTVQNVVSSFNPSFTSAENDIFYNSIPNKTSGIYKVRTVSSVNTNTKNAREYSVNEDDCRPSFSNFNYSDINNTTYALTGDRSIIIPNYSNVTITISSEDKATPTKGAGSILRYDIVAGNYTDSIDYSSSTVSKTINAIPTNVIMVYAKDSRQITKGVTKTATVKNYTNIQKGNINITRQGNVGEAVTLTFNGTFWNESFGSVANSITNVTYRYKKTSDNTWTTGTTSITPTPSGNNYSFSGGILGDTSSGFDTQYSYNIEVIVSDRLSSTTFTFVLGSGQPLIGIHNNGIAIKQPYDTNDDSVLQVNGKTNVKGNLNATGFLLEKNSQVTPIDITGTTNTLLSRVKALGTNGIFEATWFSKTDGGTSGISDKPTGTTNAGFVCHAVCDRWASNSDYRYVVTCYVQNDTIYYIAIVETATSSISWTRPIARTNLSSKTYVPYSSTNLVTVNTMAYWNGAYNSSNASNLTYAHQGTIQCKPTVLYNNANGTTGTVNLSSSVANFTRLKIYYYFSSSGVKHYGVQEIMSPNGKKTVLFLGNGSSNGMGIAINRRNISGTSITSEYNGTHVSFGGPAASNEIFIYYVEGWK